MAALRRAKEAGYSNDDWARQDPDLLCLHDNPEFIALFHPTPLKE